MPKYLTLELSPEQRAEWIDHRDHDRLHYLRERCAALLKIADGWTAAKVAHLGLHRFYDPDAIYAWVSAISRREARVPEEHLCLSPSKNRANCFMIEFYMYPGPTSTRSADRRRGAALPERTRSESAPQ